MMNYRAASRMDKVAIFNHLLNEIPVFPGQVQVAQKASNIIYDFLQGMDGSWGPVCEEEFDDKVKPHVNKVVKATGKSRSSASWCFKQFFDGAIWEDELDEEDDEDGDDE